MAPSTGPTVGQSLFTPIPYPQFRKLGRKHIHLFLRERKNYVPYISDVQATGSPIQPISIKTSIDRDFLLSFAEFGEFTVVSNASKLTDDDFQEWFNTHANVSFESLGPRELDADIKSQVRININEPDPEM